jgi:cellulose synthase operon protein C
MKNDVELIQAFLEGALTPEQTSALHERLAAEPGLQQELHAQMQLFALESEAGEGSRWGARKGSEGGARGGVQKPRRVLWQTAGVLAAASVAFLIVQPLLSRSNASLWQLEASRQHAFRVALPEAAAFRPYVVQRSGSAAAEPLTLKLLSDLESRAQWHALGVAQLLRGNVKDARQALARAPQEAEVLADVAAAALADNAPLDAIRAAFHCLELDKNSAVCRWNLGLALEAQGLVVGARTEFEKVAALKESGWADEAASRAKALQGLDSKALYLKGRKFAADWVLADVLPPKDFWKDTPGLARLAAHVVVASSTNSDSVSLAQNMLFEMDGSISKEWIQNGARHDGAQTGDFRRLYFSMLPDDVKKAIDAHGIKGLSAAEKDEFFKEVLKKGNVYQQATALLLGYGIVKYQAAYDAAMKGQADSWYGCGVPYQQARAASLTGHDAQTETALRTALTACGAHPYRMAQIESYLARVLVRKGWIADATRLAKQSWKRARSIGQEDFALYNIETLAEVARKENDYAIADAYYTELVLASAGNCLEMTRKKESLASILMRTLRFEEAKQILSSENCGELTTLGVSVMADLLRVQPETDQRPKFGAMLQSRRDRNADSKEWQLRLDTYEAIAALGENRQLAIDKFKRVLSQIGKAGDTEEGRFARSMSYRYLAIEAGQDKDWADVFRVVAAESNLPPPGECAAAIETMLERTVLATIGPDGSLKGEVLVHKTPPLQFQFSKALGDSLAGCRTVAVYGGEETTGVAKLLPRNVAWFFAAPRRSLKVAPGGIRLVIRNVEPPAFLGLPRLSSVSELPDDVEVLEAERATPAAVMRKLPLARWIEFHTHGVVNPSVSEGSHLVLSPESADLTGSYVLTARMLQSLKLEYAPVVMLGACYSASQTSHHAPDPISLPNAFLEAGARAVVAATSEIPDAAATEVSASLRRRFEQGFNMAVALRDERVSRENSASSGWVDGLIVYEEASK